MLRTKRVLSILVAAAMLVTMLAQAAAAAPEKYSFQDVRNHWAASGIEKFAELGIIQGSSNKFRPNDSISRAEICAIINKIFGFSISGKPDFEDVTKDKWYYDHVMIAKEAGYISGSGNNLFAPGESASRQEAAKIFYDVFQLEPSPARALSRIKDSGAVEDYARDAVNTLLDKGYASGSPDKFFFPKNKITRAEFITILSKLVSRLYNNTVKYPEGAVDGNVVINQPGIVLKSTSISGNLYLAPGIGEGDVTLDHVKVDGRTFIGGGGSDGVHIADSVLEETIINKDNVKIVFSGKGKFGSIVLDSKAEIIINEGTEISNMKLALSAKGSTISCKGKISAVENMAESVKINGVLLAAGSTVQVDGEKVTPAKTGTDNPGGSSNNGGNSEVPMWKLAWSDEFAGNAVDDSKWNYDLGNGGSNPGWGNNEKELYTQDPKNVYQKDGLLNITAIKDTGDASYPYSSTRIKTQGKFSKKYGKIEARIKLPEGKGLWPAFWMMPEDSVYGTWAASGEIDIMEAKGSENDRVHGTIHYGKSWPNNKYTGSTYNMPAGKKTSDWHTYAIEWEPGEIRWYVDGELYQTQNNWYSQGFNAADKYAYPAPFDQNFYIIMNLAVGGNYDGEPDGSTPFPSTMQVDYVRVYELNGRPYKTPQEPGTDLEPLPEGYQVQEDGNLIFFNQYQNGFIEESDASLVPADTIASKADGKWLFLHLTTGGSDFGGAGSISAETVGGSTFAKVDVTSAGSQAYSVQLIKTATLAKGRYYKAGFDAKSSGNRNISVKVSGDGDAGWATYSNGDTFPLTPDMNHYEFIFQMNQPSDLKARYEFNAGLNTLPVWIGNVRLEEIPAPAIDEDAAKTPLGDGNHVYNGTFDQGDMSRMRYWHLMSSDAAAEASVDAGARELKVNVADGGGSAESVRLVQRGIKLIGGQTYKVSFSARTAGAATAGEISAELLNEDGSISYSGKNSVGLSTAMEQKSFSFTMPETGDSNSQLVFNLGGETREIYLDDVVMTRVSDYIDPDVELFPLKNGFFTNTALEPWNSYIHNDGAAGTVSVENGEARIGIMDTGNETWSIQFFQNSMNMGAGIDYEVSFDARSTADRAIELVLDDSSYVRYLSETPSLTSEMKHFSYTMRLDSPQTLNLKFLLGKVGGASGAHDIYIDNVVCEVKAGKQQVNMLKNGLFTEGADGTEHWTIWSHDNSAAAAVTDGVLNISVSGTGNEFWSNQLVQGDFPLAAGKGYVLTFTASSTVNRTIRVILENSVNYTKYHEQDIVLDSNMRTYNVFFNGADDANTHLVFALGMINELLAAHDVLIGKVSLMENPYGYQAPQ